MTERGHETSPSETAVFISIDHTYIPDELEHLAQGVYDALGALDVESPEAIELFLPDDFHRVLAAAERWAATDEPTQLERVQLLAALRRIGHLPYPPTRRAWLRRG